jgi:hypothetical protein
MHDPLHHLLTQADAALSKSPRAVSAETLLAASRRKRAQSKRRRIATVGVTAALASVAVALMMSSRQFETPRETRAVVKIGPPAHIDVPAPRTPDELRQEIAALEREAAWRSKMTKSIQLANMADLANLAESQDPERTRLRELSPTDLSDPSDLSQKTDVFASPSAPSLDSAEWFRVEAARSAALSWQYANMAEHEFRDLVTARREYQRLIERFPGTTWAQRSQVSLDRILTSHKTPL